MNFFGHARLASRLYDEPLFVLGAMLPDLQRMAACRLDPALTAVQAGVRHHHAADEAFHHLPSFVGVVAAARRWLSGRGVPRGPAMALAHVGVELLLDGAWSSKDAAALRAFRDALRAPIEDALRWADDTARGRFESVRSRLLAGGVLGGYRDPAEVAHRSIRILAGRARLGVPSAHHATVHAWTRAAWPDVRAKAATVWRELEHATNSGASFGVVARPRR